MLRRADSIAEPKAERRRIGAPEAAIVLAALSLLLFITLGGFYLSDAYRSAATLAETRAAESARVVSVQVQWLMEAARQALRRVEASVEADLTGTPSVTIDDLRQAVEGLPEGVRIWVTDASGQTRFSTNPELPSMNIADRLFFKDIQNGADWSVSTMLISRVDGSKIFTVNRRLEQNGSFVGVATLSIPVASLAELWANLQLGPDSTVGLLRSDGWLVARYPEPPDTQDLSGYILFTDYLKQSGSGTYFATSPTDGLERVVGYQTVSGAPLVVIASLARSFAFDGFWANTRIWLTFAIPAIVAHILIGWWAYRVLCREQQSRETLRQALESNRVLFRETHHRVKNNLQAVLSLVQLQQIPAEAKEELGRRISAVVAVHEHIYNADDYETIAAPDYLTRLTSYLRGGAPFPIEFDTNIAAIDLDRDQALPLGLILSEVVSNAIKHAFAGIRGPKIRVAFTPEADGYARLLIADNGIGFEPDAVAARTGRRLIKALSAQLSGEFTYRAESEGGTSFSLRFPLDSRLLVESRRRSAALM